MDLYKDRLIKSSRKERICIKCNKLIPIGSSLKRRIGKNEYTNWKIWMIFEHNYDCLENSE